MRLYANSALVLKQLRERGYAVDAAVPILLTKHANSSNGQTIASDCGTILAIASSLGLGQKQLEEVFISAGAIPLIQET